MDIGGAENDRNQGQREKFFYFGNLKIENKSRKLKKSQQMWERKAIKNVNNLKTAIKRSKYVKKTILMKKNKKIRKNAENVKLLLLKKCNCVTKWSLVNLERMNPIDFNCKQMEFLLQLLKNIVRVKSCEANNCSCFASKLWTIHVYVCVYDNTSKYAHTRTCFVV